MRTDSVGRATVSARYLTQRAAPRLTVHAQAAAAAFERSLPLTDADEVHLWEEAGHFLHQERSIEFNTLALDWLRRL
ncbi:hypothetical protein [Nocardia sp. alder85J]|uniref:hypothetical protein n=1 Tax=Nocardia sp. alder85J TaxID=2862949 RepID=UPI0021061E99|nr:hypothetical protein [Nocardia sp. alder85J]MCX4098602.1 hypothetical protein [Nocardia sp. alder85J]